MDLTSPLRSSSIFSAPMLAMRSPCHAVQTVTSGARKPETSRAKTLPGGEFACIPVRCIAKRDRVCSPSRLSSRTTNISDPPHARPPIFVVGPALHDLERVVSGGCGDASDVFQSLYPRHVDAARCMPRVISSLHPQPRLRAPAKQGSDTNGHLRGERPVTSHDLVQMLPRNSNPLSDSSLGDTAVRQNIIDGLTGMGGAPRWRAPQP